MNSTSSTKLRHSYPKKPLNKPRLPEKLYNESKFYLIEKGVGQNLAGTEILNLWKNLYHREEEKQEQSTFRASSNSKNLTNFELNQALRV